MCTVRYRGWQSVTGSLFYSWSSCSQALGLTPVEITVSSLGRYFVPASSLFDCFSLSML